MIDLPAMQTECSLRLILLRHGEPSPAALGICYGKLDVELSDTGVEQVRGKLPFLRMARPHALYTSPRTRTEETARIVGDALGMSAQTVAELAEIDFGEFEGRSWDEIRKLYPEEFRMWMERPAAVTFPGGESFTALKRRVLGFTETLRQNHKGQTVLIVAHGGVNRVILADAFGMSDAMAFRIDQPFAGASVIDYFGETPLVRLING